MTVVFINPSKMIKYTLKTAKNNNKLQTLIKPLNKIA